MSDPEKDKKKAERALSLIARTKAKLALRRSRRDDPSEIERAWSTWLPGIAPSRYEADFEWFHKVFWDWYWEILMLRKAGIEVPDEIPLSAMLPWGRGLGKSACMEGMALAEGAIMGASFGVYISSTQDKAIEHLQSVRSLIESSSIDRYYPEFANPRIGKYGNQRGWRSEAIYTDGGFAIVAASIEKGVRGLRDDDRRPSFILMDDIDERDDSLKTKQEKFDTLRFDALPMLAPYGIAILGQNLIYRGSIADDTLNRRIDWFHHRLIAGVPDGKGGYGPVNTFQDDLRIEKKDGRPYIIAGTPNWSMIDNKVGQRMLSQWGEEAIWRECQNRIDPPKEELVWTGYTPSIHVISWEQFEKVFGRKRIPSDWTLVFGYDAGTTGSDRHPAVFSGAAVASEASKLPGKIFIFYEFVAEIGQNEDEMAKNLIQDLPLLCDHQGIYEAARLVRNSFLPKVPETTARDLRLRAGGLIPFHVFNGSHEANSERRIFRTVWGLPVRAGKSGKTEGLAQLRHRLKPENIPHPFKEHLIGAPDIYLLVANDQYDSTVDRFGLARHRWEAITLEWDKEITTRDVPRKFGDDATDACFIAGTLVHTKDGPVPIEKLKYGDKVCTRQGLRFVERAFCSGSKPTWKLETDNGIELIGTADHPVWVEDTVSNEGLWVPLVRCYDDLVRIYQKDILGFARVVNVERFGFSEVYNLTVEDVPEYFANGILVHNCKQYLQTFSLAAAAMSYDQKVESMLSENLQAGNMPVVKSENLTGLSPDQVRDVLWKRDSWEMRREVAIDIVKRKLGDLNKVKNLDDPFEPESPFATCEGGPWSSDMLRGED